MNSKKRKFSKPHVLILNLTDKIGLPIIKISIALISISIYYA